LGNLRTEEKKKRDGESERLIPIFYVNENPIWLFLSQEKNAISQVHRAVNEESRSYSSKCQEEFTCNEKEVIEISLFFKTETDF